MKKILRILGFVKVYKQYMVYYVVCLILSTVFSLISFGLFQPFLQIVFNQNQLLHPAQTPTSSNINERVMHYIITHLFNDNIQHNLSIVCILILVGIFLRNVFFYLSYYFLTPIRNEVHRRYTKIMYDHIIHFPISYFTQQNKGDLLSRSTHDVTELEYSIIGTLEGIIKEPVTIIGILVCMFMLSPHLTFFILLFFPLSGFIISYIGRKLRKQNYSAQQLQGAIMSHLDETITGVRVIKAFNAEKKLKNLFSTMVDELFIIKNKILHKRDLASPVSEFLGIVVVCCVLWFGGKMVLNGNVLSPSAFITFIIFFSMIINPVKALSVAFYNMQKGSAALDRLSFIENLPLETAANTTGLELTNFQHQIEFKNVSFNFGERNVLKTINLIIKKGESVALVGPSGAGKSTLADLIARFYEPTEGEILIDGKPLNSYSIHSIRQHLSLVSQEPILFNDTIKMNICLGKEDASQEEIEAAAKSAHAYNFIMLKDNKWNCKIGDRGLALSGGEKQRLTIARAILKNPQILILDEATSSLDTESERLVQMAINSMMEERTTIIIAHRLSTIKHCQKIVVLDAGQIVETGNHQELLAKKGLYYQLVHSQTNMSKDII